MLVARYRQLVTQYVRSKLDGSKLDHEWRRDGREALAVLRNERGQALVATLPETAEMRRAVRHHLADTVGLGGLDLSIGHARISGTFQPLDRRFRVAPGIDDHRRPLYCQFEVPFVVVRRGERYADRVLFEADRDGAWQCRSCCHTSIEVIDRVVAARREHTITATFPDRRSATRALGAIRRDALSTSIVDAKTRAAQATTYLYGVLRSSPRFKRIRVPAKDRVPIQITRDWPDKTARPLPGRTR